MTEQPAATTDPDATEASRPTAATHDGSPRRTPKQQAAAVERQRKRIAALAEDPDEDAWHGPARERYAAYQAELEEWQRAMEGARNRAERRAIGRGPRLELPPHPDFNKRTSAAIKGPVFGRFVVTGTPAAGDELAHDCYRATEACGVDTAEPRTFVHYAGELAEHYPDAELHAACFEA